MRHIEGRRRANHEQGCNASRACGECTEGAVQYILEIFLRHKGEELPVPDDTGMPNLEGLTSPKPSLRVDVSRGTEVCLTAIQR